MSFSPLRFGPLRFLLLLTLLAAAGLAWMWFDEHVQLRGPTWVAPKAIAPDIKVPVNPQAAGTTASDPVRFAAILERPLFAPDRRPPPPPPPPTPPPPPDPFATVQIQGIFSGTQSGILARVDGKSRRVKINETIGNWTLKSIDGRDATFTQGDETRKLRLAYAKLDAPTPPAVKASPPPAPTAAAPTTMPAGAANLPRTPQDEGREILRRRNELRTSRGLPPITE
jgi:hypothetical protein